MQSAHVMPMKTIEEAVAKLGHEMSRIARLALEMPGGFYWQSSVTRLTQTAGLLMLIATVRASAQKAQTVETMFPAQSTCAGPAPTFPPMTYDEDDGYFSSPDCRTKLLDRLKFIPLRGDNESYYLSFGAFIRERGEYSSNPNWGSGPPGNAYLMQRYFLHTYLHLGERFRFFGELASSLETGRNGGPRPGLDEEQLYVHQGFFDLGLWRSGKHDLTLRAGRQEVAFGSGSLVSTRDGRNIRLSLDGLRLTWLSGVWTIDAFALRPVLDNAGKFDNPPNHTAGFWGVYVVRPFRVLPQGNVDLYYIGLDNKSVLYDGKGIGREQRETIGTRLWGTIPRWDYNNESIFQWGWFGVDNIRAWGVSTDTRYRIDSAPLRPRFGLRAAAFSGDQNPSSRTLGTFDSMHEEGPYYSYAEVFARRNLIASQQSAELNLTDTVSLTFNPAFYWRESTSDGLYSAGNAVLVSGQKSSASYIASQASVQLRWQVNRNLSWFSEYAHFFPGDFLKQSTPGRSLNYWTGWLDIRF